MWPPNLNFPILANDYAFNFFHFRENLFLINLNTSCMGWYIRFQWRDQELTKKCMYSLVPFLQCIFLISRSIYKLDGEKKKVAQAGLQQSTSYISTLNNIAPTNSTIVVMFPTNLILLVNIAQSLHILFGLEKWLVKKRKGECSPIFLFSSNTLNPLFIVMFTKRTFFSLFHSCICSPVLAEQTTPDLRACCQLTQLKVPFSTVVVCRMI